MKLVKLGNGQFRLIEEKYTIESTWAVVSAHMIHEQGISPNDVIMAQEWISDGEFDTVNFGLFGRPCYPSNAIDDNKAVSELKAIQSVKHELVDEFLKDKDGPGYKYAQARLLNLALTIDVDATLKALGVDNKSRMVS